MPGTERERAETKCASPASELEDQAKIPEQGENSEHRKVTNIPQEKVEKEAEGTEAAEVEVGDGIKNDIQREMEGSGGETEQGELEGIVEGEAGEEESQEWKDLVDHEQSTETYHISGEEGNLGKHKELVGEGADNNQELVGEGTDGDNDNNDESGEIGDMGWVEELWNKKKAEEAAEQKNELQTKAEEEEPSKPDSEMMDECERRTDSSQTEQPEEKNQPETGSEREMTTTVKQDDTDRDKAADVPVQERGGEISSDSLLEFTKRSSCIPPAYFGPAFDKSCFQCCIRVCPVAYNDLVREDFAAVLARADCVRMNLGSKTRNSSRWLEIYCQRSAPLLYNLMFCPYSSNTVTIELIRKKPTGWKTVTLKDKVMKVPSVYSIEECTKAKFRLKTAYFRHNLGKIINVNSYQHVKQRSLFISNIPATVDRILVKHIFPLAAKITWVNGSENRRSAVLTMNSRKMVFDHMLAMTEITINGQELMIGAVGLSQEDAEKVLTEHLRKHGVRRFNSSKSSKVGKKKDTTETGERQASSKAVDARTDHGTSSKKAKPILLGESLQKAKARTGQSEKERKWARQIQEEKHRAAREKLRLEREKRAREQRENLQRGRERPWQKVQRLEKGRSSQHGTGEERGGANTRKPSQGGPSRPDFRRGPEKPQAGKQEELRGKQRVMMRPPGGNPQHQERHMQHEMEMEMHHRMEMQHEIELQCQIEMQREMALQREIELKREIEIQREIEMQRELKMQQEREMQLERKRLREMQRERELEKQREREREWLQREWQDKKQWEWKEMERRKMEEHIHQEEEEERERRHQEELLREKERLERKHQEAMHKLRLVEEQQRREREELERREQEMEAERARMQQQLEEERRRQLQERKEWERASASRKRSRFEEPGDREHGMAASKKGRGDDRPWDSSTSDLAMKRKLELEVARQAEELKNSLALLDKLQDTSDKRHSRTEKGRGGHHTGPSTAFNRTQPRNQQGYGHDSQPFDQDNDMEFQGHGEDASHFQRPGAGDGPMNATGGRGDYTKKQHYRTQNPASRQQINAPARGAGASGYGGVPRRPQEGGGGDSYHHHQGGAQHTGGSCFENPGWGARKRGGFIQGGPQRRESSGYQQGRRDNRQDGGEGRGSSNYDQAGRHGGGGDQEGRQVGDGGGGGSNYNHRQQLGLQNGRGFGQRKERWSGSSANGHRGGGQGRRDHCY